MGGLGGGAASTALVEAAGAATAATAAAAAAAGGSGRKPLERRLEEAMNIYKGLEDAGVPRAHPALEGFRAAAGRFVRGGRAEAGSAELHGLGRRLEWDLTANPARDSGATLKAAAPPLPRAGGRDRR